jgi:hypothetical protein
MNLTIIYTILIGIVAGLIGGSVGLGGSFIVLPALLLLNIVKDFNTAVGTILFTMIFPISLFAVYEYYKRKKIDFKIGTILVISYSIAAYFGAKLNEVHDIKTLFYVTSFIFCILSIFFFYFAHKMVK